MTKGSYLGRKRSFILEEGVTSTVICKYPVVTIGVPPES